MTRVLPDIPNITAEWTHECSEIPDYLVVPLADGRVIRYYPRLDKPTFVRRADGKVGYQYKSKIFEGVEI
jgi:hypothetical protein